MSIADTPRTRERRSLKERLGAGELTLASAIRAPEARDLRVAELLMSRPYQGPQRAKRALLDAGVDLDACCGELTEAELERIAPSEGSMALRAKLSRGAIGLREAFRSRDAAALRIEMVLSALPNTAARRVATILAAAGVEPGSRCHALDPNQIEALVAAATPRRSRPSERATAIEVPRVAPLREREREARVIAERLRVQQAEREALYRMSRLERRRAYERGELTAYQREVWAANFFGEAVFQTNDGKTVRLASRIPECGLINGELPWIAATLADNER